MAMMGTLKSTPTAFPASASASASASLFESFESFDWIDWIDLKMWIRLVCLETTNFHRGFHSS